MAMVMREERPTHLALFPAWFPGITRGGRARVVYRASATNYSVANAPQDELVVYEVLALPRAAR